MNELRQLLRLMHGARRPLAAGIALALLTLLANIALLGLSGWFITGMALAGISGAMFNYFTPAAGIRGLAILRTGGRYAERLISHDATLRLLAELRVWFYQQIDRLTPGQLGDYHSADLFSRLRADIDRLDRFYLGVLLPLGAGLLGLLLLGLFVGLYLPWLALGLLLPLLAAGIALPLRLLPAQQRLQAQTVQQMSGLRQQCIETAQGRDELRLYRADRQQLQQLQHSSRGLGQQQRQLARLRGLTQAGLIGAGGLALWLALWLGLPALQGGRIDGAQLAMLVLLSLAALETVIPMPAAFEAIGQTLASARRLFEIAQREPAVSEPATPEPLPPTVTEIRVEQLGYRYPGQHEPALADVSLRIQSGEHIGLTGASGSGKSTLLRLLLKLATPDSGRLCIGDIDLQRLDGGQWRQQVALLPQRPRLLTGTLRENLLLAAARADDEPLLAVCQQVGLGGLLERLPEGLDSTIGEAGEQLSGGELKRVALAQALLRRPRLLILDEPFEGLDRPAVEQLLERLRALPNTTLLLVSHQPIELAAMDRLLVLDRGRVVLDAGGAQADSWLRRYLIG